MKKFTTFIALILALASVMVLASCRMNGNDGKDTSTPPADTTTPSPSSPDDSTTPNETTAEPWGPGTTVPGDTTTTAPEETTIAPEDIVWTDASGTVYVSQSNVWLRSEPTLDDTSRQVVLKLGDNLTCIATSDSWYKVSYGGDTCYIAASCVTTDNLSGNDFESVSDKVYVTVDSAWLRLGPSTDTEQLSYALKGAELTRVAKSSDWSRVTVEDKTYYISNSCISETKPE